MRDEVTEIRRPRSLVNEDAVAERDFDLSHWITWVIGLYVLAGHHVVIFHPGAVGRNPLRIIDNLRRMAQSRYQRKFSASYSDLICLYLFSALPQCQLKGRNVDCDSYVRLAGL